jgi:serine/threonine protein kinase
VPVEEVTAVELVDPLVGTIFDKRFRIDERLAAGGFGAIYRATHVKSGHQIALKIVHPTLASDLGVLARFRREGTTLTALRNPHTITAYEYGQSDKMLFIVLELLQGDSLFEVYSTGGPMEWRRVVHIGRQVCESLEEAHAQGIVHRDLKPTNIHLEHVNDDPDFVKVLDFGIAKIVRGSTEHDASDITNAGQMIGTLDYMSPEQMVGGQVTGQTDIYTLGIVMYEMMAGTRPFPESETASAALGAMLRTVPKPLYLRAPVPREVDAIVMKCLERDTAKRYRSVGELRADLDTVAGELAASTSGTEVMKKRPFDDNDATAITPPPGSVLDSLRGSGPSITHDDLAESMETLRTPRMELKPPPTPTLGERTPSVELKTPKVERTVRPDSSPSMKTPKVERRPTPVASTPWDDDDERAPTTTRRPDNTDDTPPPARRKSTSSIPSIPPTPPVRPLESRHISTPVPQLVVAPFSQPPRPPEPLGPPSDPRPRPPTVQPPFGGSIATPRAPGTGPYAPPIQTPMQMQQVPYVTARPPTGYDMSGMAARDATIRRLIWIVLVGVALVVGFAVAAIL